MTNSAQVAEPSPARRALVTVGAVALMWAGLQVLLPGVVAEAARAFAERQGVNPGWFSIFGLGMTPIVTIAFVLEVAKLVFPALRAWEARSDANRTRLQRIWLVLSLLMAAVQAQGVADGLSRVSGLVPDQSPAFVPVAVATLVGATAFLFWLALVVTRFGLVDGLWLLLAAQAAARLPEFVRIGAAIVAYGPSDLNMAALAGAALLAGCIALILVAARIGFDCEPDRVGALVWPPIIGFYGATMALAPAAALAPHSFAAHVGVRLALFAALAFVVALMRAPQGEPAASGNARLAAVALQIAIVVGGVLTGQTFGAPVDGIALIVTAVVVQNLIQNMRNQR